MLSEKICGIDLLEVGNIFVDCKKYEEALREDSELWNIKILGAFSQNKIQNPVRDNYAVLGFSECDDEDGLLSKELCRGIKRKIHIKAYTCENGDGGEAIEILSRICKKLKCLFPNEIGDMRFLACEYTTKPYAYCAEAEIELCGCYGGNDALADVFKEEI